MSPTATRGQLLKVRPAGPLGPVPNPATGSHNHANLRYELEAPNFQYPWPDRRPASPRVAGPVHRPALGGSLLPSIARAWSPPCERVSSMALGCRRPEESLVMRNSSGPHAGTTQESATVTTGRQRWAARAQSRYRRRQGVLPQLSISRRSGVSLTTEPA